MSHGQRKHRLGKGASAFASLVLGLSLFAVVATPGEARACGGCFCGVPPNPFAPLPIAQNGENVVFAITKDPAGGAPTLEAHIQILYTGDVAKFSWVVPVDAVPTLGTGTDLLFSSLSSVTAPSFQPTYRTTGTCYYPPTQTIPGNPGPVFGTTGAAGSTGTAAGVPGVQVAFQGAVGPFDAAVIKSDDPMALKKWLTDNGYVISDQASGIIDAYVQENKYFVALKLLNGVGVNQIQPITLKFHGVEACVPLRLTAIAANPDMPVLVWVLGDTRVAPRGYHELQIDDASIEWTQNGGNYFGPKGLVSKAANEAGGKAFITEYAGKSQIASGLVYRNGQINLTALGQAMTPPAYVQLLVQMGLAGDPLMLGLLQKYIPMPDAVVKMNTTPAQFYGNLQNYWSQFAFPAFDLAGLTAAISTSIVMPRTNAQMMIDAHPVLTRLNTFISPDEMDADPFFFEAQDLADVSNVHRATIETLCGNQEYMACNAPTRLVLADGRKIWLSAGSKGTTCGDGNAIYTYHDFVASLPATSAAWDREVMGDGQVVLDNRTKIAMAIDARNKTFPTEQQMFTGTPLSGGGGAGGGPSGGGGAGMGGAGGLGGPGANGSHGNDACGCSAGAGSPGGAAFVGFVGWGALGLAFARRRRARR
jgi:MYXO-CTERM domain-containing protein